MKKKKKKAVVVQDTEPEPTPEASTSTSEAAVAPEIQPTAEAEVEKPDSLKVSKVALDDAGSGAVTPVDGAAGDGPDGADLFADMKKKKKKSKKEMPPDIGAMTDIATASAEGLEKKKKSKKLASDFAKELGELEQEHADEEAAKLDDDLGEDPFAQPGANGDGADDDEDNGQGAWVKEGREATYPELLRRFFTLLHQHNPELAGEKRRYTIVPPQVAREGTKKTMFSNLTDICRRMHRQPEHMIQFLYSELGTQGSVDGNQRLIMKGRYTQKQIENVLRKYIVEYVTCGICKSPDTLLGKENRLYFMTCESCGSRRSVSAIKAGYQAQIGKRIKAA